MTNEIAGQNSTGSSSPDWIPQHIPELDGLRGIAILSVFIFHARGRHFSPAYDAAAAWGWTGVSLFFVLSGYLITSILLNLRNRPHYFRNFYARRILRIWPVYYLAVAICFLGPAWLLKLPAEISAAKALVIVTFFVQNLVSAPIFESGALGPTWSVAIEEQYYLFWAPIVRYIRSKAVLAAGLAGILIASPIVRLHYAATWKSTHTLLHLDCIAWGSLLAVALAGVRFTRAMWFYLGAALALAGFASLATWAQGTVFADSAIAVGFAGAVLIAIAGTGSKGIFLRALRCAPLRFYGRVSYGFYMTHLGIFMSLGLFYEKIDKSALGGMVAANALIVLVQFAACTIAAALLWYGMEKKVLRLKKYF